MDNTEKLLRASIEASGYEICEGNHLFINGIFKEDLHSIVPAKEGDDVRYESYYKVTKKESTQQDEMFSFTRRFDPTDPGSLIRYDFGESIL